MDDGVALISTAHPRAPWWRRWYRWLPPRLSEDALEQITIQVPARCHFCGAMEGTRELFVCHRDVYVCDFCITTLAMIVDNNFWETRYETWEEFAP